MEVEKILPGLSGLLVIFLFAYPVISQYHLENKRNGPFRIIICEYTSTIDLYEHLFIFTSLWAVIVMRILMFQHISETKARISIILISIGLVFHFMAARTFTGVYKKETFLGIQDEPYGHRVYLVLSFAILLPTFLYLVEGENLAKKIQRFRVSLILLAIIAFYGVYEIGNHTDCLFIFPSFSLVYLIIANFVTFHLK